MTAMARPPVMTITPAAAKRIKAMMSKAEGEVIGLRVGVKNGGCAGMAYTMDYAEGFGKFDEVVDIEGAKVVIDPKAIMFLLGTEMDYEVTTLSSGFTFNNPNQTSACGCGESIALSPASPEALAQFSR